MAIQKASVQDRNGAAKVIECMVEKWNKIIRIFADGGYSGGLIEALKPLKSNIGFKQKPINFPSRLKNRFKILNPNIEILNKF